MKPTKLVTEQLLDELISVFFHKLILYVPSEVITEEILEQLKDDVDRDLLDVLMYLDNELGVSIFNNKDALELNSYLIEKRSFLQQNTFKLLEKSKELTEFEFLVVIEKYYEFLTLFIHISEWMSLNLKKYNGEDIHISIVGAYNIQLSYFVTHLKDVCNYFGAFLDLELEYDFSKQSLVFRYLPELIARYSLSVNQPKDTKQEKEEESENELPENPVENTTTKKKKQKPQIDEKKIERMILTQIFNVKEEVLE